MSRSSSDILNEIVSFGELAESASKNGNFEVALNRIQEISRLLKEAKKRLCYEIDCKNAVLFSASARRIE